MVSPYVTLGPHSREGTQCRKFHWSIPHFGNLFDWPLGVWKCKEIFSHCNFYLLVCENAKRLFHTATFTSWCVKMQQTFSHYNFYSLGVEKKRSRSLESCKRDTWQRTSQQEPTNKQIYFSWVEKGTEAFAIHNWAELTTKFATELWYLKHSQRFQPPTKCGVCFLLEVWSLLLRTKFCGRDCWYFLHLLQAVRKPKAHSFVCLFVCLFDWLIDLNLHQESAVLL